MLPEGTEERILRAAEILLRRGVADLTLLGDPDEIARRTRELGVDLGDARLVDPATSEWRDEFAARYARAARATGASPLDLAHDSWSADVNYFGTHDGGRRAAPTAWSPGPPTPPPPPSGRPSRSSGPCRTCRWRPACSSCCSPTGCWSTATARSTPTRTPPSSPTSRSPRRDTAARFGIEPRVAMLSYSTGSSGAGADVEKVAAATALVRERRPDLLVEGPIQYDAAIDPAVAATKLPEQRGRRPGHGLHLPGPEHRATTRTRRCSGRPARSPSARSCRACAGRSTTCPGARPCRTSSTRWRSPPSRRPPRRSMTSGAGAQLRVVVGEVPALRRGPDGRPRALVERIGEPGGGRRPTTPPRSGRSWPSSTWTGLAAVGHRVVHGGRTFTAPVRDRRRGGRPRSRSWSRSPRCTTRPTWPASRWPGKLLPDVPQVAVFDTAFHHTLPRGRRHLRDRPGHRRAGTTSAGTASTAPRTRTCPAAPPSCWAARTSSST